MNGAESDSGMMRWLGMNFRASGLGVFSVWMKIVRAPLGRARNSGFEVVARASGLAVEERFGSRDAVDRARDALGAAVARRSALCAARRSACPFEAIFLPNSPKKKEVVYRKE